MQQIKLPQMNCEKVSREIGDFVIASVLANQSVDASSAFPVALIPVHVRR